MLVTKKAPDFTATTVMGNNEIVEDFNLYKNLGEKLNYSLGFNYPYLDKQMSKYVIDLYNESINMGTTYYSQTYV